jgi:hypothetical protein
LDATASRSYSWELSRTLTAAMFNAIPGELDIALAWHAGTKLQEITTFSSDAAPFTNAIRSMRTESGQTRLNEILAAATKMTPPIRVFVYVGDCYEEDEKEAYIYARRLNRIHTTCFFFHDASSTDAYNQNYIDALATAKTVFENIVAITGGMVLPFTRNAPDEIKNLLEAIAVYAAGGVKLLEERRKTLAAAPKLLASLNERR